MSANPIAINAQTPSEEREDIIILDLNKGNFIQRLAFSNSKRNGSLRLFWLLYILHYIIYFKDIYSTDQLFKHYFNVNAQLTSNDIIICSIPPTGFLIKTYKLIKKNTIPLIVDYRDPWTYGYRILNVNHIFYLFRVLLERRAEKNILSYALNVFTVSESLKRFFPRKIRGKISVLKNGANVSAINKERITDQFDVFRIIYSGTLYRSQLKDESFFFNLICFIETNHIKPGQLELCFLGAGQELLLKKIINKYRLNDFTTISDRLPLEESMEVMCSASVFLHLKYGSRSKIITSKQADYLALQKPILLPLTDHGDIAQSIVENNAGYVCNSKEECLAALNELWRKFQNKESFVIERPADFHYKLSREYEAQKLVAIVKELMDERSSEASPAHKK
ncbi:glycosyltransferase family 4 protein (plasmid) [Pedobacter sp. BS3]|uniref:glycosyltransferase family 4 protein n=1 Tax=Pedobacter sp. BS3 TaxID=2567937 RepID=UPI0011EEDBF1|nr:glycosyltransferase family 4 protein [Pedobacter sp. BS3]TZF86458.1 glycosyltransferase family 4 protein [Pedobacter sp. BS3]